jgi:ABC-type multidrug transport system fused ATPase/permease subunit
MHVGDKGVNLSGGQRQRIGLARALLTNPQFLVLDEATSALDGDTKDNISQAIQALRQEMTIVMIAHRLPTVRLADLLIYIEGGKVISPGTFEELKRDIPNFNRQAMLMGL